MTLSSPWACVAGAVHGGRIARERGGRRPSACCATYRALRAAAACAAGGRSRTARAGVLTYDLMGNRRVAESRRRFRRVEHRQCYAGRLEPPRKILCALEERARKARLHYASAAVYARCSLAESGGHLEGLWRVVPGGPRDRRKMLARPRAPLRPVCGIGMLSPRPPLAAGPLRMRPLGHCPEHRILKKAIAPWGWPRGRGIAPRPLSWRRRAKRRALSQSVFFAGRKAVLSGNEMK